MSRLRLKNAEDPQSATDGLLHEMERRLAAAPPGICPVGLMLSFLTLCHTQSCGKCVPCRIGIRQMENMLRDILNGKADMETLKLLENTAKTVYDSADCAIGYSTALMVEQGLKAFRDDFMEHITKHRCLGSFEVPVPCMATCPANVDVPGYISLVQEGRYADAVRLIRKDNPFPAACAYVCEHPCENRCRRNILDDALNIRGLKRSAVDNAGIVAPPECAEPTGKSVAVVGSGPAGLTAAYYLALMGHSVTVFEKREKLGGMLRYGIPAYRLPRKVLDSDIDAILSTGVEVRKNTDVGADISAEELFNSYDSVFLSIGAHIGGSARIDGEDLGGVISAVSFLRDMGDEKHRDFTGKTVAVIGGGNVAMDATRTSVRLGADKVYCVYRRRKEDMTALPEEVEGAMAEGAELLTLRAPARIEGDENGNAAALWVKQQIPGEMGSDGRPRPTDAGLPEERIAADVIIVAVGQKIESAEFEKTGLPVERGEIKAMASGQVLRGGKIFAGGDCVTGPASAIRAIAAGKVAAGNIDAFLGYDHKISVDVNIPDISSTINRPLRGRINSEERMAGERKNDFECMECGLTEGEAKTEASRCLHCDFFGYGVFHGGRQREW